MQQSGSQDRPSVAKGIEVLLVEDNPADVYLTISALRDARIANDVYTASDGEGALAFLRQEGIHAHAPRPDLVLLDLNLPKLDGHQVLAQMKADRDLCRIPVVVISGSSSPRDVLRAYEGQIAGYIVKSPQLDEYFTAIRTLKELWFHAFTLPPKTTGEGAGN